LKECPCCGQAVENDVTTFTVVKNSNVWVVQNVPCIKCTICEFICFTEDVAKKLEKISNGKMMSSAISLPAWVYDWKKPMFEIPANTSDFPFVTYSPNSPMPMFVKVRSGTG
jgi:ferredoxin